MAKVIGTDIDMLDSIEQLNLAGYPQPSSNGRSAIVDALNRVLEADNADSFDDTYNQFLHAIGNNHAGTYYPVALAVIPVLGDILQIGSAHAQSWVLNVLIDLCGPFVPEFEHRYFRDEPLQRLLIRSVAKLLPVIQPLTASDCTVAEDARELVGLINRRLAEL